MNNGCSIDVSKSVVSQISQIQNLEAKKTKNSEKGTKKAGSIKGENCWDIQPCQISL